MEYFEDRYRNLIHMSMERTFKNAYPFISQKEIQNKRKEHYATVLIRLWTKIDHLRDKLNVIDKDKVDDFTVHWIWKVTENCIKNVIRYERKEFRHQQKASSYRDSGPVGDIHSEGYDVRENMIQKEIIRKIFQEDTKKEKNFQIKEVLWAIPKVLDQQESLVIRYILTGLTETEIAQLMGFHDHGKVNRLKSKAIKNLRRYFNTCDKIS